MKRIHRHLELYCCEGGSGVGYQGASNDEVEVRVYGVDLFEDYTQKRCPFPTAKGDVIFALNHLLTGKSIIFTDPVTREKTSLRLEDFDSIGASPPCQHASAGTRAQDRDKYPRLIEPTRELLVRICIDYGIPYVIENVKGADLIDPIMLCGRMFNLHAHDDDGTFMVMDRHRLFESNLELIAPHHAKHDPKVQVAGSYGGARRDKVEARLVRGGGYVPSAAVQRDLLGIDWMTQKGMHQSIPPVYTTYIMKQILEKVGA